VEFLFKTPEDAQIFAEHFGGERLAVTPRPASASGPTVEKLRT
jgi:hypothetical protein